MYCTIINTSIILNPKQHFRKKEKIDKRIRKRKGWKRARTLKEKSPVVGVVEDVVRGGRRVAKTRGREEACSFVLRSEEVEQSVV